MLRKKHQNLSPFNISGLDLFASALGAFILISIVLMPYYLKKTKINDLDIVFVMDTTGSMDDEISDLTKSIRSIVNILQRLSPNLHVGFVAYRDQGLDEYTTKLFPLKKMDGVNLKLIEGFVSSLEAKGGGDTPEAVDIGINDAINMPWRTDSHIVKHIILIGDAPAHAEKIQSTLTIVQNFHKRPGGTWKVSSIYTGKYGLSFFRDIAQHGGGVYSLEKGNILENILISAIEKKHK